jgi:hypothetical protein
MVKIESLLRRHRFSAYPLLPPERSQDTGRQRCTEKIDKLRFIGPGELECCFRLVRHAPNPLVTQAPLSYYPDVREIRIARALVAVLCIALLLLFSAIGPSAAHLDLALPALLFCFLVVFTLSLLRVAADSAAVQSISFLTVNTSRAPPLA